MKEKIKITPEMLAKENENKGGLLIFYIFLVLGIAVVFIPLLYIHSITKTLLDMGIFFIVGFIPFGYFCGLRMIIKLKKRYNLYKNGKYRVVEDTVTDVSNLVRSAGDTEDPKYSIELEWYSRRYKKVIPTPICDRYSSVKEGDKCFIILIDEEKGTVGGLYPASKYYI